TTISRTKTARPEYQVGPFLFVAPLSDRAMPTDLSNTHRQPVNPKCNLKGDLWLRKKSNRVTA
ncbi:MAG TPA: hypothetical protein VJ882_00110, partial [Desulfuromonadales bacterium]|nr:hypothetical protein [Desulfuromonadales bacterium]